MSPGTLLEVLLGLAGRLPLRLLHALGAGLGTLAAWLPNEARHIARVNSEMCFGDRDLGERKRLARCALRETGKGALELGWVWCRPIEQVLARVQRVEGEAVFREALAAGEGVIVLAPHLGCWEVLQTWIGRHASAHALYRPPRQQALERVIHRARSRTGVRFWPTTGAGVRALFRALHNGQLVGVLPDQQPPGEGVYAPFFGHPAKTMTLIGKLAARSGAPVLTGWAERLPQGRGYAIHWHRVASEIAARDPERAAAALNRAVEDVARQCPCQYQWTYRRFSRQPAGTRNPYRRFRRHRGWIRGV